MAKIFFSYTSEDKIFVASLAEELAIRGHVIFQFEADFAGGEPWIEKLSQELIESDAVIIILSQASAASPWIMHEAGAALGYSREKGRPLVIPVLADDVPIPGLLGIFQAVSGTDRNYSRMADRIDQALQHHFGRLQAKEEVRKEVAERVEETAGDYISRSRLDLQRREDRFRRTALFWYGLALCSLIVAVVFAIWRGMLAQDVATWPDFGKLVGVGVLVVVLFLALAKLCFSLGKSYMVEALRNADRSHAISFGEFYLKAFGDQAEWREAKEALQHWNIDKGSAFLGQDAREFDPELLAAALELARVAAGRSQRKSKPS